MKDRFVATVSHELRTPLTSLKGFTRMLLEDYDVDEGERAEFLGLMADQAEELHGRIEDLITFSRMGADSITIKPEPLEFRDLIQRVLADLGVRAEGVDSEVPADLVVFADPPRLRQVMRNLLDNALEYGDAPVTVVAEEDGGQIRCAVLDAGRGIPPEEADLVFEPYSRLIQDPTMSSPGLGLGLPIVQGTDRCARRPGQDHHPRGHEGGRVHIARRPAAVDHYRQSPKSEYPAMPSKAWHRDGSLA